MRASPPSGVNGTFALWSSSAPISSTPSSAEAIALQLERQQRQGRLAGGRAGDARFAGRLDAVAGHDQRHPGVELDASVPGFSIRIAMSTVPPRGSRTAVAEVRCGG